MSESNIEWILQMREEKHPKNPLNSGEGAVISLLHTWDTTASGLVLQEGALQAFTHPGNTHCLETLQVLQTLPLLEKNC